jgi:glycosyltransferase involved in cell wall biosynthesis
LAYNRADAVIAISRAIVEDLMATCSVSASKIAYVPNNPVVTPTLLASAVAVPEHPWFTLGEPPVVLAVGRLGAEKDLATLIRAFALVRRNRSCRLLILGDGDQRDYLQQCAQNHGVAADVAMPGFNPNPYPYMAHCGVFVLSSRFEGQPNVLIEALACGAAVVSTDCASGPREVLSDGKYGTLVPVGDAEALAAGIEVALDNPPARKLQRARGLEFTVEAGVERCLPVLLPA